MIQPVHAVMDQFEVIDDCLVIGGLPLPDVAAVAGRTPFYAYDRGVISKRVAAVRAALPTAVQIHYAIKANPMPALVCHLAGLVDGLDVASGGELVNALSSGMPAREISFAGPGKSPIELEQAVAAGILVNVESFRELHILADVAGRLGKAARVAIRVNPEFELKSSGMKMGGGPKQFGVDAGQVPGLLAEVGRLKLRFEGFHLFAGSQNLRADAVIEAQTQSLLLAMQLADHAPDDVKVINIGGGFGIPYFPGEQRLDIERIGAALTELLPRVKERLPEARIIIELGRYLVGESGIYVSRIVDRKTSQGQVFLVTDGGLHHHLSASGNFGQVLRKNYPVAIGTRLHSGSREVVSVVGPLCTPLDLLADRLELAKADLGDLVVVFQSGAYGLTASPHRFLGHPEPAELLL